MRQAVIRFTGQIDITCQVCEVGEKDNLPIQSKGGSATNNIFDRPNADIQPILSGGETVKRNLYFLLSLVVLASMILTACGGAVPATQAPAATEAPEQPAAP